MKNIDISIKYKPLIFINVFGFQIQLYKILLPTGLQLQVIYIRL